MNQEQSEASSHLKKRAGTLEDIIYCYNLVYLSLINCFDDDVKDNESIKELVINDTYQIISSLLIPITSNDIIVEMQDRYNNKRKMSFDKIISEKPSLYNQLTEKSIYDETKTYLKGLMFNLL